MANKRDAYWDNLKLVLIFLVVFGHFLLPIPKKTGHLTAIYYWIYAFHMPVFIFSSGFFAKKYVERNNKAQKLTGYLALYLLFTVMIWVISLIFSGTVNFGILLEVSGTPWYLLGMFFWYLLILFAARIKPVIAFPFFIIFSLLAGLDPDCGSFLAISRVITFFPFFLAGYYFDRRLIDKIRPWMRVIAAALFVAVYCIFYFFRDRLKVFFWFFTARKPYPELGISNMQGIIYKSIWYIMAAVLLAAFLCLIPNRRFRITYIGERTLGIYILHRLARDVMSNFGFYYIENRKLLFILCFLASAVMVFVFSPKLFTTFFNKFFHLDFLLRREKES